jgi:hypothetical protein
MLQKFLQIIQQGEVQSHLEIAQKLKISPGMALQMAHDLARMGYLEESGGDCCSPTPASGGGHSCGGCAASSACQVAFRQWALTKKGGKAVEKG